MRGRHPYAHSQQRTATVCLAVFGVAAAYAWGALTRAFALNVPWWLDAPAVFGFYGLLYSLYDRWLWRVLPFRLVHGIPNLNGRYKVTIRSSHDDHVKPIEASAAIVQSWSQISIRLETETSSSTNGVAWLSDAPGEGFTITYVYTNKPESGAPARLRGHEGTASVTFDPNGRGVGSYYSGRDRKKHGSLLFERSA